MDKATLHKLRKAKKRPTLQKGEIISNIDSFDIEVSKLLSKYFECETIAKKLINCSYKKEYVLAYFSISQLKVAIEFYDIRVSVEDLNIIFHSYYKNGGIRSVRCLRNQIVHGLNKQAIKNLKKYKALYETKMDLFIEKTLQK